MKHGGIVTQDNRQEKTRTRVSKFYGKLPPNVVEDLDGLLLKMKETNKKLLKKKVIDASEIKPLSDEEYLRLWGYIRHCCDLVSTWKNVRNAIAITSSLPTPGKTCSGFTPCAAAIASTRSEAVGSG